MAGCSNPVTFSSLIRQLLNSSYVSAIPLKVGEMKDNLKKQFYELTKFRNAHSWLDEGIGCQLLSATEGQGWKRGYPGLEEKPTGQGESIGDFPQKGVGPQ